MDEVSEELARWMQEMGRRRSPRVPVVAGPPAPATQPVTELRRSIFIGVLALAYMQFFFADTFLQIARLPSIIVFVLTGNVS